VECGGAGSRGACSGAVAADNSSGIRGGHLEAHGSSLSGCGEGGDDRVTGSDNAALELMLEERLLENVFTNSSG
ncbi:MAG: hypothetical protein HC933_04035, partial [Pleurocapsa sp. SU_196_0]|nr:hypothetical protein [Pleurocapsa sp. SU_196_0]